MSQPDNQPSYVTCLCQHCNGHIKFESSQLRIGETGRIECPHCHLETIIFHPPISGKDLPPAEKINQAPVESSDRNSNSKQPKSSKMELFFFEFTRFITLIGAFLVLIAFIAAAVLAIQTLLPEIPKKPVPVPYEIVAPVQQTAPTSEKSFVPIGAKMADKNTFPQPVVDFLLKHEGYSLKEWLHQIKYEHRQAFLDNLATILQTVKTKHLTNEQAEQVVKDFAETWIDWNEKAPEKDSTLEKQIFRASCISVAFGLLITLTIFCLILVLLAIERNTRLAIKKTG